MRVLEFSLRETSSLPIELRSIDSFGLTIPMPMHARNQPRTPFSFQRFLIPELCGYRGRAIYLDADMQVFADIASLWNHPMKRHELLAVQETGAHGRKGQFSVMLLDCARLRWSIEEIVRGLDAGRFSYEQLLHEMCVAADVGRVLPEAWNSLESFDPQGTCLLHYTDMHTQPWVSTANGLAHLWVGCLRRALEAGFITRSEVVREVAASNVRPSLLAQLEAGVDDPKALAAQARQADRAFVAPYRRLPRGGGVLQRARRLASRLLPRAGMDP